MSFPVSEDGVFDGGLLFDGCGHRQPHEIVAFSHAPNRLGIVKDKRGYFVAEFLSKHSAPQFSLPVWDAVRDPVICGSIAEAQALTEAFTNEPIA
jgi:hypothetical protein